MSFFSTVSAAREHLDLKEFKLWLRTEEGLRQRCIEMGWQQAKDCGLLKQLHDVTTVNQLAAWDKAMEIAERAVQAEGDLFNDKVIEFAEDAILEMGYAPPHWRYQQVAEYLEEQRRQIENSEGADA